eukprot:10275546-Karenia_brevis.AAC.1
MKKGSASSSTLEFQSSGKLATSNQQYETRTLAVPLKSPKVRREQQRAAERQKKYAEERKNRLGGKSFLERRSVSVPMEKTYVTHFQDLESFAK